MSPLEELRTQGDKIVWLPEHDLIMKKLRDILSEQLMIEYPDFTKPLIVGTDASKYGIGGVLYQLVGECDDLTDVQELIKRPKRYIRFASRALTPSERNYGAPQRELLGVLYALRTFRPYLFGRFFRLLTDHKSLTYMLERPKVSSVILNWLDEILQFNFKMEHVPGILNLLPDKISRIYDFDEREEALPLVLTVLGETEQTMDMEDLAVIEDLEVRKTILERAHVLGHFGAADMARTIRSTTRSTWPNLARDCQKLVSACIPCQRYNIGKMGYQPMKSIQAILPLDHIAIDLKSMPISKHGNAYYLLIIDVATRFVFLRPLASKSAYSVAQPLLRLFCDLGFPKILQSDNGGEFSNEVMAALKKLGGFDHRLISAYHHRSNGIAERAIQSTSHAIYKSMGGLISQWDEYLPAIQYTFNTRVVELHGSSPYALMFGRAPNGFQDYRDTEMQLEKESDRESRLLFLNSVVFPAVFEKVGRAHSKRQLDFAKSHRMLKEDYPPDYQGRNEVCEASTFL
jgi:transposase InsO family protein